MKTKKLGVIGLAFLLSCIAANAGISKMLWASQDMKQDLKGLNTRLCELRNGMYYDSSAWSKVDRAKIEKNGFMKRWIQVHDDICRAELKATGMLKDIGEKVEY